MKTKQIFDAVGETTHVAGEKAQEAVQHAQEYFVPLVEEALEQAQEYLAPFADQAREKGVAFAAQTKDSLQPRLDEAIELVQHELVPKLTAALEQAAEHPLAVETSRRLSAATAALAGELDLPDPKHVVEQVSEQVSDAVAEVTGHKKPSVGATIAKVAVAGALLAAVAAAVKQFLDTRDTGWQAHHPSTPYVPQGAATVADGIADDLEAAEMVAEGAPVVEPEPEPETAEAAAEPVEEAVAEAVDEPVVAEADAEAAPAGYGEGSFVGAEPPEGFSIKGNERSMKYHVEGSGGYERTIADVWFTDEGAAEAAGFTKAQR